MNVSREIYEQFFCKFQKQLHEEFPEHCEGEFLANWLVEELLKVSRGNSRTFFSEVFLRPCDNIFLYFFLQIIACGIPGPDLGLEKASEKKVNNKYSPSISNNCKKTFLYNSKWCFRRFSCNKHCLMQFLKFFFFFEYVFYKIVPECETCLHFKRIKTDHSGCSGGAIKFARHFFWELFCEIFA